MCAGVCVSVTECVCYGCIRVCICSYICVRICTTLSCMCKDYLLVQRDVAFGKKNVSSAAPVSGLWLPTLASLYYQDTSTNPLGDTPGCSFWIELSMPTFLVRDYGTAEAVWVRLHVDGDGTIGANLRWIQKTATRLPEAHMLGFGAPGQSVGPWVVDKLGSYVDVRPTQMAPYCSTHLHAVGEGGVKDMDSGTTIRSLDAALVSLGRSANPYPSPVVHAGDPDATARDGAADGSGELNFVLQNNLWDTNYPVSRAHCHICEYVCRWLSSRCQNYISSHIVLMDSSVSHENIALPFCRCGSRSMPLGVTWSFVSGSTCGDFEAFEKICV